MFLPTIIYKLVVFRVHLEALAFLIFKSVYASDAIKIIIVAILFQQPY